MKCPARSPSAGGSAAFFQKEYLPTLVYCKEPRGVYDRGRNFFEFPQTDLFVAELGHFVERISGARLDDRNSLADSIGLMRVLDAAMRTPEGVRVD